MRPRSPLRSPLRAAGKSVFEVRGGLPPVAPPGAPTIGTATAGNAQATVTWTAPASAGGAPITGYRITSSPGGITATVGNVTSGAITGLTNGVAYTFTVAATNGSYGPESAASNSVTPSASTEIIANGTFAESTDWTLGAGWTISGGTLNCSFSGSSTLASTAVTGAPQGAGSYRIRFTINSTNAGFSFALVNSSGAGIYSSPVYNGAQSVDVTVSVTGAETFFGTGVSAFQFSGSTTTMTGVIDNLSIIKS